MASQFRFTSFSNIPNITTKAYSSEYLRTDGSYFLSAENYTDNFAEEVKPDPTRVIILHPGSYWLRFGIASDALPCVVPHVIARRHASPHNDGHTFSDKLRDVSYPIPHNDPEWMQSFDKAVRASEEDFKTRSHIAHRRITPNAKALCTSFNTTIAQRELEIIPDHNDPYRVDWTVVDEDESHVIIGEGALGLSPEYAQSYKVRWPFLRKGLNTVDYDSLQEIMGDLTSLWREAIRTQLHIVLKEFKNYYVVLVIPDDFHRNAVAAMVDALFTMNFRAVMVVQESPCATFAAGISSACVVDLGAQTTSIACIDEGMIVTGSRITLPYGQDIVTRYFVQLLVVRNVFPYQQFNLQCIWDRYTIEELKERYCTLNEHEISLHTTNFMVRRPSESTKKYAIKMYDEVFIAPAAMFCEKALQHLIWEQKYSLYKEKPVNYLSCMVDDGTDDFNVQWVPLVSNKPKPLSSAGPDKPSATKPTPMDADTINVDTPEPFIHQPPKELDATALATLPLDQAVLRSINACPSEAHIKRALNNIILIGGGSRLNGLSDHLQSRLAADPRIAQQGWDRLLRILVGARELDPRILAWKGATVMARLDSSSDLWLLPQEWKAANIRLLRDKVTFLW